MPPSGNGRNRNTTNNILFKANTSESTNWDRAEKIPPTCLCYSEPLGSIFVKNISTAHWVIVGTGLVNVETSLAELGELLLLTSSPRPLNIEGARDTMPQASS